MDKKVIGMVCRLMRKAYICGLNENIKTYSIWKSKKTDEE